MQWGIIECCRVVVGLLFLYVSYPVLNPAYATRQTFGSCIEGIAGVIQLMLQWFFFTVM